MSSEHQRWAALSLDELVNRFEEEITPAWTAAASSTERAVPTAQWLDENGFGGLRYALREHHDLTYGEFLDEMASSGEQAPNPPDATVEKGVPGLSIRDDRTREALKAYWDSRVERDLLEASTLASKRSRLKLYLQSYRATHETDGIVPAASDPADQPTEIQRAYRACDRMGEQLDSDSSRETYLRDVTAIYGWLETRGYTAFNPLSEAQAELGEEWTAPMPDNSAVTADQVRNLVQGAANPEERLLVVGLAAWGLRPSELAMLHVQQLEIDGGDPHITFEKRKNGPSTVTVLYGQSVLTELLDERIADDEWNGYLYPSKLSHTGHVHPDTIRNRFKRLATRMGVRVNGETPTPKMCRRYWYSIYTEAAAEVLEQIEYVAEEQGSSSATVVLENYLSEDQRRQLRRSAMRNRLSTVFHRNS